MNISPIQTKKVPRLRFPEFSGEWQEKRLGEIGKTYNGLQGKTAEDFGSGLPFITYKQIFDSPAIDRSKFGLVQISAQENQSMAKQGDVFFTTSSETPLEVGFSSVLLEHVGVLYLNSFCFGFRINNNRELLPEFSQYLFRGQRFRKLIYKLAQGSTRYNMSKNEFVKIVVSLPVFDEQQKIADFLTAVDHKVAGFEKKKELLEKYKDGVMQAVFSQKIRFKDENGKDYPDWVEKKFSECLESVSIRENRIQSSEIHKSGKYPVVDQGQVEVAGYSNESTKVFKGTPVIVFGDHTTFIKFIDYDFIVGADGTKILHSKSENLKYLFYYLEFNKIEPEGYKRHFSILKNLKLRLPGIAEQQKIADFLTSIDEKINFTESELEQAKKFKKALLQQMFA